MLPQSVHNPLLRSVHEKHTPADFLIRSRAGLRRPPRILSSCIGVGRTDGQFPRTRARGPDENLGRDETYLCAAVTYNLSNTLDKEGEISDADGL